MHNIQDQLKKLTFVEVPVCGDHLFFLKISLAMK